MSNPIIGGYEEVSKEARLRVLDLIFKAQVSHIGSNFSAIDIMAVLFEKIDLSKDKFVLSAGWKAASLYYFLWKKGKITNEQLDSFCQGDSPFIGLAEPIIPEITIAGGSMGLGLPGAVGLALAKKLKKEDGRIYVLMSDGEQAIGTTHESALIAAQHELNNLVVIVDNNKLQAMGKTKDILNIEPLEEKWQAWGWNAMRVNGHKYEEVKMALDIKKHEKPFVIIADTIKGEGVSFMERQNLYHYKQLSSEEFNNAKQEING